MKYVRLLLVVIGCAIVGLGVAIAVKSGFGADPITVLWDGITKIIPVTIGQASIILSVILLAGVLIIDRKQINVGTVVNPIVIGAATDIFSKYAIHSSSVIINVIFLVIGILLIGFGLALYSYANFGRGAYEALVFGIVERFHLNFAYVRTAFDFSFVIIGVLLGGKLSAGPIAALISLGFIIQKFTNLLESINLFNLVEEV